MPHESENRITYFARAAFRNDNRVFGIKRADRRSHLYLIGATGTGKSTLLNTLALSDAEHGEGLALIDPHGDLVEDIVQHIPSHRKADLIYFNAPDTARPFAFNPLEWVPPEKRSLAASGLLQAFKKIWDDSWGPRTEHVLRNALLALFEQPEATLADILRLIDDRAFRSRVARNVTNKEVRNFWLGEYEQYSWKFRAVVAAPIQNKVGAFLSNPILNTILTSHKSSFDLRTVLDEGNILLVNLAKGKIGDDAAALLGALLLATIGFAGLSRADVAEEKRKDFYLYLDEFQTYTTLHLATMLSELRKYRVNVILAHQYLSQLDRKVRDAVLANAGTIVSFRVGPQDSKLFAEEFYQVFTAYNLMHLANFDMYLKLMIDGTISRPFSARTFPSLKELNLYRKKRDLEQVTGKPCRSKSDISEWSL